MSASSQNLLEAKLPEEIGLKELKIMQLKKKKVRVSAASPDVLPPEKNNDSNYQLPSINKNQLSPKVESALLPVIENKN